jgi:hypothetical protein
MRISLLIFAVIITVLCSFKPGTGPVMTFTETKHNFGFIRQGDVVSHEFEFTNTGDGPLIISGFDVACECTKVEFPKEPIAPNAKGKIKVTFESKSAIDRQEREVIVKSNAANSPQTVVFKCVVLKPKN